MVICTITYAIVIDMHIQGFSNQTRYYKSEDYKTDAIRRRHCCQILSNIKCKFDEFYSFGVDSIWFEWSTILVQWPAGKESSRSWFYIVFATRIRRDWIKATAIVEVRSLLLVLYLPTFPLAKWKIKSGKTTWVLACLLLPSVLSAKFAKWLLVIPSWTWS